MKTIKFICYYDYYLDNENRYSSQAAINKINYICESLESNNFLVNIITPAHTCNNKFYFGKKKKILKKTYLKTFFTIGVKNRIINYFFKLLTFLEFAIYLIFNTKKNETLIVYHSISFYKLFNLLKKIKKIKIILEVEEIYQKAGNYNFVEKQEEYNFFKLADKFIFITRELKDIINIHNKPFCIVHGTYKVNPQLVVKNIDGKIHILYSGIIDQLKKGAFTAVKIAKYLKENYVIHIIGFGNEEDVKKLKELIVKNNEVNKCKIIYDGLKKGDEYIKYVQMCDIGLSTQNPNAEYNNTSFPSKILSYLCNGLRVVTINIPVIKTSDVYEILYSYMNDDPREIADTIKSININDKYNSKDLIKKLDKKFKMELMGVINDK